MMYRVCEGCGSNLDHGEICDCKNEKPVEVIKELQTIKKFYKSEPLHCRDYETQHNDKTNRRLQNA